MRGIFSYIDVTESLSNTNFPAAIKLIQQYFSKHDLWTKTSVITVSLDGVEYHGIFVFSAKTMLGCVLLFEKDTNVNLVGLHFTKNSAGFMMTISEGGFSKFDFSLENLHGVNVTVVLPLVEKILNGVVKLDKKAIVSFLDSKSMYESLDESKLDDLKKAKGKLIQKRYYGKKEGQDVSDIDAQIESIKHQMVVLKGATIGVSSKVTDDLEPFEEELEDRATPNERFSDMESYIRMVIKGIRPSLMICGAPGVGKTFRVMRMIKASGKNYKVIKGKETPLAFYIDLFLYHHKGDILICDDADDILTDDTCTNLIKAATDSSDERIITYGTSKPPAMTEEEFMSLPAEDQNICGIMEVHGGTIHLYPKSFITEAGIIIITNKNAGQIDTAVRNRGIICDLAFTVQEILGVIKELMPDIRPNTLHREAKQKALDYLMDLADKGSKMDISIRSFCTTADVYEVVTDEKQAQRMIREQMKLQSLRGGKKY